VHRRVIAALVDVVIALAAVAVGRFKEPSDCLCSASQTVIFLGQLAWIVLYPLLADGAFRGQSVGKKLLHMRVVGADGISPCTVGRSVVRNALKWGLGPIDWLFIFGNRRQRLGDRLAKTFVIEA
jgi:uncharacterized RDD family membrane protein YckC